MCQIDIRLEIYFELIYCVFKNKRFYTHTRKGLSIISKLKVFHRFWS